MAGPWDQFPDAAPQQAQPQQTAVDPWAAFPSASAPQTATPAVPRSADEVRAEYDAAPVYKQIPQAADDVLRLVANGMSFGYADKLAGYMNGTGTAAERAKSQEAMDRAGVAGPAAEMTGAVALPIGAAGQGLSLAGRFGTAALKGLPGVLARTGLMATEGAGYGAANAAGHDEDMKHGALMGAIFGTGGNLVGETVSTLANKAAGVIGRAAGINTKPVIPTIDQVQQAATNAYKAADNAGVVYTPQAVDRLNTDITQKLADMGYDPALQPGAAAVVNRLQSLMGGTSKNAQPQNITLTGLDSLRKVASNGYIPGNASNNRAVLLMVKAIDEAVANPQGGDVLMGNAQAGADALAQARSLWSRVAKANTVNDALDSAERRAAVSGTGSNGDNAVRQRMNSIEERGASRGFTPDEDAALRTAIFGTPTQNALRWAGRFSPTSPFNSGVGGFVGYNIGHALGGPELGMAAAGAVPAAGFLAKRAADAMSDTNVKNLLDIIMAGGTKAATQAAPNAAQRAIDANRTNLGRMFMGGALESGER